ncbi:serine hydrolase domain-containing protein [Aspergillus lucknowensis]|uniref:Beta-lactamase/transpeptidase-like protein n=1 Tax=Aspergillus lucknowensis TaxID=176173 RepID=A0ABR4L9G3_9EURO
MRPHSSFFLTSLCLPGALSNFLGPIYPAPRDLTSSDSLVAAGWKNLARKFETSLGSSSNSALSQLNDLTFSVGLFSTHDSSAERLQYHHTAPEIANSATGTRKVDGDSIYRIASVSKLFTVLAGLIELKGQDWERPLSELFPAFAQSLRERSGTVDPVYDTQWDAITPRALASQMGGIAQYGAPWNTDYLTLHALNTSDPLSDPATYALPPVNKSDPAIWPPCATLEGFLHGSCAPGDYTVGVSSNPPIFLPWASPAYSNNGLTILGLAISNLTGKSMEEVYQESIFDPLDMQSSYSNVPPDSELSRSVVAGVYDQGFALVNGISTPSGGLFSTLNDLAKFSTGVLNSTLLTPTETRRWMKPVTHMSDLHYSIGAPWEIYRYEHPDTGLVTDIYTKLGDSGNYGSMTLFLPDFDAGINVITASSKTTRSAQTLFLIQQVVDVILPALTNQAARELARNYAGTYVATANNLNSSMTFVAAQRGPPGLVISSWISNGTDLAPWLPYIINARSYGLRPTISPLGNEGQMVFRPATTPTEPVRPGNPSNLFTNFYQADQFAQLGQATYAGQYLSEFVFDVEADGSVSAVTPAAWRVRLEKRE